MLHTPFQLYRMGVHELSYVSEYKNRVKSFSHGEIVFFKKNISLIDLTSYAIPTYAVRRFEAVTIGRMFCTTSPKTVAME